MRLCNIVFCVSLSLSLVPSLHKANKEMSLETHYTTSRKILEPCIYCEKVTTLLTVQVLGTAHIKTVYLWNVTPCI